MRLVTLTSVVLVVLVAGALLLGGCSSPAPPQSPQATQLNAALATASTSVGDASTYIIGLKQAIPGAPSNDDLEKLQTTVNAASSQTGATQQASAKSALEQFDSGVDKVTKAYDAAAAGSPEQEQLRQLIVTLKVGRDALAEALK